MKGICTAFLTLALVLTPTLTRARTELAKNPPEAYRFSYQTASNGRVVPSSVCKEYSGLDWKGSDAMPNGISLCSAGSSVTT